MTAVDESRRRRGFSDGDGVRPLRDKPCLFVWSGIVVESVARKPCRTAQLLSIGRYTAILRVGDTVAMLGRQNHPEVKAALG